MRLHKFHLYFGIIIFLVFLLTGQYMDRTYNHLSDMEDLPRALMRAQHLYILLAGLVHIGLGSSAFDMNNKRINNFRYLASFLITIATLLLIYSFFTELPSDLIERPLCRLALYIILAGGLLHGLSAAFLSLTSTKE